MRYGTRPARNGHLRVRVFRQGRAKPLAEVVNATQPKITRGTKHIEEAGTFALHMDAVTTWWWVKVERPKAEVEAEPELVKVVEQLKSGRLWFPTRGSGRWIKVHAKDRAALVRARAQIERLYDTASDRVPGGQAGARLMLRHVAQKLGPNTDPAKALQIRVLSVFPRSIRASWRDDVGKKHMCRRDIKDIDEYSRLVSSQMQQWSNLLFQISGGKLALYHKTRVADGPLTQLKTIRKRYYVTPGCIQSLVNVGRGEITALVFWFARDGQDPPPWFANSYIMPGTVAGAGPTQCIFVCTDMTRLRDPEGWTKLTGGLPHEFWHFMRRVLQANGFKGFLPDNHKPEDFERLKREIVLQGLTPPQHQYEELYATIPSWRMCGKLRGQYGWRRDWGRGPDNPVGK